jgi:hypothetical protein
MRDEFILLRQTPQKCLDTVVCPGKPMELLGQTISHGWNLCEDPNGQT